MPDGLWELLVVEIILLKLTVMRLEIFTLLFIQEAAILDLKLQIIIRKWPGDSLIILKTLIFMQQLQSLKLKGDKKKSSLYRALRRPFVQIFRNPWLM